MTSEYDDPIFDALLAEALGKRQPPDLGPRILQAWADSKKADSKKIASGTKTFKQSETSKQPKINGHAPKSGMPHLDHVAEPVLPSPLVVQVIPVSSPAGSQKALIRRDRFSNMAALALAGCIIGIGLTVGLVALRSARLGQLGQPSLAVQPSAPAADRAKLAVNAPPRVQTDAATQIASTSIPANAALAPSASELAANSSPATANAEPAPAAEAVPQRVARPRPIDAEVVASINHELNRLWVSAAVKPTTAVSDEQWCQRLYSSLLGRAARPAELNRSLDEMASGGREFLVKRLLSAPRYKQEFAQHWASAGATMLLGTRGGLAGSLASRDELKKYLQTAFEAERPVDTIVFELLTATGSALPGSADYDPAVNFLLERWDASGVQATGRVARVLLGHDLQCAQCHQHPTENWTQEQFWSLNAFLRQMRVERTGGTPRIVNVDFLGQRRGSRDGEIFFETPTGLMKSAFPKFIDGTEVATSGMLSVVDRRRELARLVTQSPDFARTMVDNVWKQLLSFGLESSGSNDPRGLDEGLLEPLAAEFVSSDYDLASLVRWIVLSEPFSRAGQITDLATKDLPEAGEPALFTRFYERRRSPGDALQLLLAASKIRAGQPGAAARTQARLDWLVQVNNQKSQAKQKAATGTKAKKAEPKPASAILAEPAAPAGLNSPVRDRGLIATLVAGPLPFEKKVEHLFATAIARPPTPREIRTATELLAASSDDQAGVLEEVWWALVNSSECVLER